MPQRRARQCVIAFANNKGGVRKTSTVVNVGGQLALNGFRVLIVGLDSQYGENIFRDLGGDDRSDNGASLAAAMMGQGQATIVKDVRPNLDVIADGAQLEQVLQYVYGRAYTGEGSRDDAFGLLRPVLDSLDDDYDFILIDCPPATRPLIQAGLGAARWLVIPTATDGGSIDSLAGTAVEFVAAREHNPELELVGILMTASTYGATKVREMAGAQLEAMFEGQVPYIFKHFTRFAEASAVRARAESLLAHEVVAIDNSGGWQTTSEPLARDYEDIWEELITQINEKEQNNG